MRTGALISKITTQDETLALALSRDGKTLVTYSSLYDGLEIFYPPATQGNKINPLNGSSSTFDFSADAKSALVTQKDGKSYLLSVETWEVLHPLDLAVTKTLLLASHDPAGDIGTSSSGSFLVSSGDKLHQVDPLTGKHKEVINMPGRITTYTIGLQLGAICDDKGNCRSFSVPDLQAKAEYSGLSGKEVEHVSLSKDGKHVASLTSSEIHVWEAGSGSPLYKVANNFQLRFTFFSPYGRYLFASSWQDHLQVWDNHVGGKQLAGINAHSGVITVLSPGQERCQRDGGSWVVLGKGDGRVLKLKVCE